MFSIAREGVPEESLLRTHRGTVHPERWGNHGDCFSVSVERAASLADFVFAFYTSPLFRKACSDCSSGFIFCIRSCCCRRRKGE